MSTPGSWDEIEMRGSTPYDKWVNHQELDVALAGLGGGGGATSLFVPPSQFSPYSGTPGWGVSNAIITVPAWRLSATTVQALSGSCELPSDWASFTASLVLSPMANNGSAAARMSLSTYSRDWPGTSQALPDHVTNVVLGNTVGEPVLMTTPTMTPSAQRRFATMNIIRYGSDAADVLTSEVAFMGVILDKVA